MLNSLPPALPPALPPSQLDPPYRRFSTRRYFLPVLRHPALSRFLATNSRACGPSVGSKLVRNTPRMIRSKTWFLFKDVEILDLTRFLTNWHTPSPSAPQLINCPMESKIQRWRGSGRGVWEEEGRRKREGGEGSAYLICSPLGTFTRPARGGIYNPEILIALKRSSICR